MIRIQNIYYMLAYAFKVLRKQGYRDVATEEFSNVAELCAAILTHGISAQLKRGLGREYADITEPISSLRGKIELGESIKTRSITRRQLVCSYDNFSVDTQMNRILKATCLLLIRSDISKALKKKIKQLLPYFAEVKNIDLSNTAWRFRYDRNNQTYRMLINVCWLVWNGLLQTQSDGSVRMMDFLDEQRMHSLYEKFILEYFRQEHPQLSAAAPHIPWSLDDNFDYMLPTMKSDVVLSSGNVSLIIDAKYYSKTTQEQFDRKSIHSGNLYQIFTYTKNMQADLGVNQRVAGLLLYARTDEDAQPDMTYKMSGNEISVKTLNLDCPFDSIRKQLDKIAEGYFGEPACSLSRISR